MKTVYINVVVDSHNLNITIEKAKELLKKLENAIMIAEFDKYSMHNDAEISYESEREF